MSAEKNIPLPLPPGVYKQGTEYQARGRWFDANGVRWHAGSMAPIGGWKSILAANLVTQLTIAMTPRAALSWKSNAELALLAIGATKDNGTPLVDSDDPGYLWLYIDGVLTDITPNDLATGRINGAQIGGLYGAGPFGIGDYGVGAGARTLIPPSTWQLDNYGQLLIATYTADGRILQADPVLGTDATVVPGAPLLNRAVVVTPERFLVALGADGDGRSVAWADQSSALTDAADWTPTDANQAGRFPLPTKGTLRCGRRTRRQTLLWTDVDLYAMTYIGGTYVYAFEQLGDGCGIIGPNACIVLGDLAVWMGLGGFFGYDGALAPIPCDVEDYVFKGLDKSQAAKIVAVPNALFNEVTWHYPALADGTGENSRYVTYNWKEKHWSVGKLARGAGVDGGVHEHPILVDPTGKLWEHEVTQVRAGMTPYAESGPVEIAEGDSVMQVQKIIPDEKTRGDVSMTLYASRSPTGAERSAGPYVADEITSVRISGRQVRLRIDEAVATDWIFGIPRLTVVLGGRR